MTRADVVRPYSARIEFGLKLDTAAGVALADRLREALARYDATPSMSPRGHVEILLTVPATGLGWATEQALTVVSAAAVPARPAAVEVRSSPGFFSPPSRRADLLDAAEVAGLLEESVDHVADLLERRVISSTVVEGTRLVARAEVETLVRRGGRP